MKLNVAFSIESEDFIFEFLESFKRTKRHALREIMLIVPSNIIEKKKLWSCFYIKTVEIPLHIKCGLNKSFRKIC